MPNAPRPAAAPPQDPYRAMLLGGALPAVVVAVAAVVVASVVAGTPGAAGGTLAAVVVLASFGSSVWVMSRTARSAPQLVMAVALLTYVTKIGVLGLFLVLFIDATWLSGDAFAVTAMVVALVWLAGELRAFTRARTLVFSSAPEPDSLPES